MKLPKNINITVNNSNYACMQYGGNQQIQVNLSPAFGELHKLQSKMIEETNAVLTPPRLVLPQKIQKPFESLKKSTVSKGPVLSQQAKSII